MNKSILSLILAALPTAPILGGPFRHLEIRI